ncbi:MAG: hypothetical protein IJ219_01405 [Bacteroidaceae bacterium]|nr:hypothetical protein [Bacteroidaceae bacterium]MBQ9293570.1 hypothetical protein [Bacteroidaceae bacterium]
MKKTYITPAILEVRLGTVNIICGSDLHEDGGNIVGTVYDDNASGVGLTKESKSLWDNEW